LSADGRSARATLDLRRFELAASAVLSRLSAVLEARVEASQPITEAKIAHVSRLIASAAPGSPYPVAAWPGGIGSSRS
jgi:hypothetical protein